MERITHKSSNYHSVHHTSYIPGRFICSISWSCLTYISRCSCKDRTNSCQTNPVFLSMQLLGEAVRWEKITKQFPSQRNAKQREFRRFDTFVIFPVFVLRVGYKARTFHARRTPIYLPFPAGHDSLQHHPRFSTSFSLCQTPHGCNADRLSFHFHWLSRIWCWFNNCSTSAAACSIAVFRMTLPCYDQKQCDGWYSWESCPFVSE